MVYDPRDDVSCFYWTLLTVLYWYKPRWKFVYVVLSNLLVTSVRSWGIQCRSCAFAILPAQPTCQQNVLPVRKRVLLTVREDAVTWAAEQLTAVTDRRWRKQTATTTSSAVAGESIPRRVCVAHLRLRGIQSRPTMLVTLCWKWGIARLISIRVETLKKILRTPSWWLLPTKQV